MKMETIKSMDEPAPAKKIDEGDEKVKKKKKRKALAAALSSAFSRGKKSAFQRSFEATLAAGKKAKES